MKTYTFQIDDIVVPFESAVDFSQTYERLSNVTTLRTMSGRGIRQGTYAKLKTSLSGTGWKPLALDGLDPFVPHTLHCGAPMSVSSALNVLTLPTGRRIDTGYEPTAMALVGDSLVETDVTVTGNVATCTVIPGALGYRVIYYPKLRVFVDVKDNTNLRNADFAWSLDCEEV